MKQKTSIEPWTKSLLSEYKAYRKAYYSASTENVQRSKEFHLEEKRLLETYSSKSISPENNNEEEHILPNQTQDETLLLLVDSSGKEHYMDKLLENLENVEQNLGNFKQDMNWNLQQMSATCNPIENSLISETSNTFLEYVSQHHSKGEVVSKEALKVMRQMYRKLDKTAPSSASTQQILHALRQKWASYNAKFHETESRFKDSVSDMIRLNGHLREKLCYEETDDVLQLKAIRTFAISNSKWENLHEVTQSREREIESLHRDLNELNLSYQEFHCLVLHQGSILDDIRHNIALGKESMDHGIHSIISSNKSFSPCRIM